MAAKIHTIKCKNRLTIYLHLLEIIIRGILTLTVGQNSDQFTSTSEKPPSRGTISHPSDTEAAEARWSQSGDDRSTVIGGAHRRPALIGRLGGRVYQFSLRLDISLHQFRKVINMDLPPVTSSFCLWTYR